MLKTVGEYVRIRKDVLGASSWIGLAQVLSFAMGLFTTAILARCVSVDDFGLYQLVFSYVAVAKMTTLPGMTQALGKATVKGYDALYYRIIKLSLYGSIIGACVFFGGWVYFRFFGSNAMLGDLLLVAGISFPIYALEKWDTVFVSKRLFSISRQLTIVSSFVSLLLIGGTAYVTRDLLRVFVASCLSQVLFISLTFWRVNKLLIHVKENLSLEKTLLTFGWKMTYFAAFGLLVGKLDRIILGTLNPAALAVYHVGTRIPEVIKANAKAFMMVPIANWSALDMKDNVQRVVRYWWVFLCVGCVASLLVWIISPWAIVALFGSKFADSVYVTQLLSLTIGLAFVKYIISNLDLMQGDGVAYRRITIATQLIYLPLVFILGNKYSVLGVVSAVLVVEVLSFVCFAVHFVYVYRKLPQGVNGKFLGQALV